MWNMIARFIEDIYFVMYPPDPRWELFFASHREFIHGPYYGGQGAVMFLERKDAVIEHTRRGVKR